MCRVFAISATNLSYNICMCIIRFKIQPIYMSPWTDIAIPKASGKLPVEGQLLYCPHQHVIGVINLQAGIGLNPGTQEPHCQQICNLQSPCLVQLLLPTLLLMHIYVSFFSSRLRLFILVKRTSISMSGGTGSVSKKPFWYCFISSGFRKEATSLPSCVTTRFFPYF